MVQTDYSMEMGSELPFAGNPEFYPDCKNLVMKRLIKPSGENSRMSNFSN
jgi:hypothetical protein